MIRPASRLIDGTLDVEPGQVTSLPEQSSAFVTVWNSADVPIGVGGAALEADNLLAPGESLTLWVARAGLVHVLHRGKSAAKITYLIGV